MSGSASSSRKIPDAQGGPAIVELDPNVLRKTVRAALSEDLGERGDVTSEAVLTRACTAAGFLIAREGLVMAGAPVAREVFLQLDPTLSFDVHQAEGARVEAGRRVATIRGDARSILSGERTALNFLMRMCGIATAANAAVAEVEGTRCRILDTRKTAPGLRHLDKYAVACGGATNHRMGLHDAVMIKDTHLDIGCDISEAVRRARERGHAAERITVELRDPDRIEEVIVAGAGRILLDNMDLDAMRRAVRIADGRIELEASGGLRPGKLRPVAETGVDCISLGWLTHSAPAANLAMETERRE